MEHKQEIEIKRKEKKNTLKRERGFTIFSMLSFYPSFFCREPLLFPSVSSSQLQQQLCLLLSHSHFLCQWLKKRKDEPTERGFQSSFVLG